VASIRLYLETLQTHPVDETKRQEFYRIMLHDSDRLLSTIEQVLRTGRVGPSRRKLNIVPIDLGAVIDGCIDRAAKLYRVPGGGVRHQRDDGASPVTIMGDLEEVQAAVSNLIDNAVKYSGNQVDVNVKMIPVDGFVTVSVSDRGPGIPPNELKRVFKRFYRVPGQLAIRVKGTGLGLYIVRSVARRHGGRAWAESAGLGQGSTFFLQLPSARSGAR
jgi:signal transduction histidine kinase